MLFRLRNDITTQVRLLPIVLSTRYESVSVAAIEVERAPNRREMRSLQTPLRRLVRAHTLAYHRIAYETKSCRRVRCWSVNYSRGYVVERGQADLGGYAPPKETGSVKKQALKDQIEIYDRLISAFQAKPRPEWKKLIAFSKKWPELANGVFGRFVLFCPSGSWHACNCYMLHVKISK
jgi:hypothetical protein